MKRKASECEGESSSTKYESSKRSKLIDELKKAIHTFLPWTKASDKTLSVQSKIISSEGCTAQTLTVSDQHATLLLTSQDNVTSEDGTTSTKEVKSILKLTLVPFHKETLGSNPVLEPGDDLKPEIKTLENNSQASSQIISFLQAYDFRLKSESGAEYSYYDASPSTLKSNPSDNVGSKMKVPGSFDAELISPASDRQIKRNLPTSSTSLIEETPETYREVVKPYIQSIVDSGSLGWIFNIIQGKKEQERLLLDHESFIINIDTKWRSHPDAFKTPRDEWYQHESVVDLYCLGIIKQEGIASLRDLRKNHIPVLKAMKEEGLKVIEKVYGIKSDQIRVFVHYHPQFYHFHVHFTRLYNEIGSTVERGHLISDIIQNLALDSEYYSKRTITYKLSVSSPLYLLLQDQNKEVVKEEEQAKSERVREGDEETEQEKGTRAQE